MKKILIVSVTLVLCGMANAQVNKGNAAAAPKMSSHLKVFQQAMNSGDIPTGIISLNYYVSEQPNTVYEDTLAMLYLQGGSYEQCYYWADKRSKVRPDDNALLEMKGICLEKLQEPKEAIVAFEKLYSRTQSPYHAYKLMELQYTIKRLTECLATAASAEKLQYKPEYVMTYSMGSKSGRTYLQAGVYNIHGLALYDLDRKAEAKIYFEKAVALDSNFVLARQNLEAMKTMEAGGKTNDPAKQENSPASPANKQD
jgi:tetratricopeptide (TPR) repeat protein